MLENLELIPQLLQKVEALEARLKKLTPIIATKKDVADALGVTTRTINNYIERGYLKEGYHFHRKNGKILVFIEDAILEFRDECKKGMYEKVTT